MPATLQAVAWARRPLPFLERCQKHFGDIFTIRVKHAGTWVILADPEDVKKVFTADHAVLGVGLANSILGPLLGPRSVMLLEEPEHVRRRKLMLPPFHGERMRGYSETMAEIARREAATWPMGEPFELWPRMQEITLESIMRVTFGPVDSDSLRDLRTSLRRLTNWMNDPRRLNLLAAAGPTRFAGNSDYREMMDPVERGVLAEVRRRQRDPGCTDGSDIAAMLAEARYEDGAPMTEQDLRDELVTLLTDGPTSSLLSWAFERLLRYPEQCVRLRAGDRSRRGRLISRRGREGDDAAVPGRANRGAQAAAADASRRLYDPGRDDSRALRTSGAPPTGRVSRTAALQARAVPRAGGWELNQHIHVDSLRRRRTPLSRRSLCAATYEASDRDHRERGQSTAGRAKIGASAKERDRVRPPSPRQCHFDASWL